jgi:predicted kinase
MKLYMTKGLPASGKSTWARKMASDNPETVVEVTKDELRKLPNCPSNRNRERWVIEKRDEIINEALKAGKDVICHDTNFNPVHEKRLRDMARAHRADFEVVDFTDISPSECVRRDALRVESVGAHVIWKMWQQYCYNPQFVPTAGEDCPEVALVDIDGTVAKMNGRGPFQWHRVGQDLPNEPVIRLVQDLNASGTSIIFLSGRDAVCRRETIEWLDKHVGVPYQLFMRPEGDSRKDSDVKRELFYGNIHGRYRVRLVLDDRDQVVYLWRTELNLPCLQVDYGAF